MSLSQGYLYVFDVYGPQVSGSPEQGEVTNVLIKCLLQGTLLQLIILGPYLNLVHVIRVLPNSGLYLTGDAGEGEVDVEDDFRDIAVTYLRITVIVEIMDYALALMSAYFVILEKKRYVCIIAIVPVAVHVCANYFLISVLGLKVEGLGLAAIAGRLFALTLTLGICIFNVKIGEIPWNGFSTKILKGWKPMLKHGLAGSVIVFTRLCLLELSVFCSQFVSTATLSAIVILVQVCLMVLWPITLAISLSAANLMGTALAEGSVSGVKQYIFLTLFNTLLEVMPLSLLAYAIRGYLVGIFSHDSEITDLFISTFWLICVGLPFTHLQVGVNRGMLTAFGEQGYTATTTSIASYVIGLPVVLATIFFTDLGLIGIIGGLTIAELVLFCTGVVKIWRTDVKEEIEKSRERVKISTSGSLNGENAESGSVHSNSAHSTEKKELGFRRPDSREYGYQNVSYTKGLLTTENISDEILTDNDVGLNGGTRNVLISFFFALILFIALAIISFI
ncbi:hypothetical protein ACHWQZ_G009290 [Mnemiopsis leidyi]